MIYKTLVLTGLRRGELAGLTWADFTLDGPTAWVEVPASLAKNGKSETLPLRNDLAAELREWRKENGRPAPTARVFTVPKALVKILDRDLVLAGIARRVKGEDDKWRIDKLDEEGRVIDVNALRHCTASYLAKAGVAPRTAQKLMRHSRIELTMGAYTDTRLLDLAGAPDAQPLLSDNPQGGKMRATGTDGQTNPLVGQLVGKRAQRGVALQVFAQTL